MPTTTTRLHSSRQGQQKKALLSCQTTARMSIPLLLVLTCIICTQGHNDQKLLPRHSDGSPRQRPVLSSTTSTLLPSNASFFSDEKAAHDVAFVLEDCPPRGGASAEKNNKDHATTTSSPMENSAANDKNDNGDEETPSLVAKDDNDDDNSIAISPFRDMASLFRFHNELKAAAASPDDEGLVSPHNKGRGGALAVMKAPLQQQQQQRAASSLFGAFDTSSVKPLSSRLIKDEVNAANEKDEKTKGKHNDKIAATSLEKTTHKDEPNNISQQQKVWWNSAWQQQFPDGQVIEEIEVMTQDEGPTREALKPMNPEITNDDEEEDFDELERIVKAAKEEREKKKGKSISPKDDVTAEQKGDAPTRLVLIPKDETQRRELVPSSKKKYQPLSPYESSGLWNAIDGVCSLGLSAAFPSLRISRQWRVVRKQTARVTGMHGFLSGKKRPVVLSVEVPEDDERMGMVRRRLAAIDRARGNLELAEKGNEQARRRRGFFGRRYVDTEDLEEAERQASIERQMAQRRALEIARHKRVHEIDELITQGQKRLLELVTEKDILQRRPNPMWNYTTSLEELDRAHRLVENVTSTAEVDDSLVPSREFNFPPPDLVEEYLSMLFASGRLIKLNHTDLWKNNLDDSDEDDDEWLSPLKDKMGQTESRSKDQKNGNGGGSRWLRNGLGEKLGLTVETAAYRAVGGGVMSFLARLISSIHGINVMGHTDIRLFPEQTPNLPPVAGIIPGTMGSSSYAQGAFENVLRRGSHKSKKRRKRRDDSFIQRDAVVETLLSQCQIAMPLLGIFPLAWQRAMIGNIVTLVTATMMDFCEGLEFQILGHRLSFSFVPITEEDMMRHLASAATDVFSRRHKDAARFEAAVRATAQDVAENLKFLDRWHERVLGGDALKTQLSNLVARLVLTLVDETLSGARMDLWTTHAGGPRLIAGLEYRTKGTQQ